MVVLVQVCAVEYGVCQRLLASPTERKTGDGGRRQETGAEDRRRGQKTGDGGRRQAKRRRHRGQGDERLLLGYAALHRLG
jgi:hypothetical protein